MKIEHFAINVEDPRAMVDWYVENLNMEIIRQMEEAPYLTFMADETGTGIIEVYRNPEEMVPDYRNMDPLLIHIAFISPDAEADKHRLIGAGASLVEENRLDEGSHMVMLRDPWGFSIQLWQRTKPLGA